MSGICGIFNLDGGSVSREALAAMSSAMKHRGRDGESSRAGQSWAFSYQKLAVTPESLAEVQPAASNSGAVLLWDGRLDNREELVAQLEDGLDAQSPDVEIVLAAYAAWGEDFVRRLEGDFSLALLNPAKRELILARDVFGSRTLYYGFTADSVFFASEIKALRAHPEVFLAPDDLTLAEWLYSIPDMSEPTRTFFKGIHTVPAGHMVRISPEQRSLQRHWTFDFGKEVRFSRHDEYVEAYREAFARAVRKRLRSAYPVAVTVSGGIDSSSVFCMAHTLARANPVPELIGIAMVPSDPLANEDVFQTAIEKQYGITLHRMALDSAYLLRGGNYRPAWYSEGPFLQWEPWKEMLRSASSRGARVFLTGFFGDNLLTNPQFILDLLFRGRVAAAAHHLYRAYFWWQDSSHRERRTRLYRHLKGYVFPERLRPLIHRSRRKLGRRASLPGSWYSARLTTAAESVLARNSPVVTPPATAHARIIAHYLNSRLLEMKRDMESKTGAEFGCEDVHPFRDRVLVQLVMAMPGEEIYRTGARGIHREALAGVLPESIRLRRTKAAFTEPARSGALQDLTLLTAMVTDGQARKMGYLIEDTALRTRLESLRQELAAARDATLLWSMGDLVGLEDWLAAFFPEPEPHR